MFTISISEQQFEIPEEEAEWLGLNLEEAVEKQRQLEHKVSPRTQQAVLPHTQMARVKVVELMLCKILKKLLTLTPER